MLVIGYGNPGRGDDGLGPAFAERVARAGLPGVEVSVDYQLTVEHALALTDADRVVFADALMGAAEPFRFRRVHPDADCDIGSHMFAPGAVLALAATLYGARPEAHVMAISGAEFGTVSEGLSAAAAGNLDAAAAHFLRWAGGASMAAPGGAIAAAAG